MGKEAKQEKEFNIYHCIITNVTPSCHVYAIHSCEAYATERASAPHTNMHVVNSLKIYSGAHFVR